MLASVQQAVLDSRQLRLRYTARNDEQTERDVEPLGITNKGNSWYLVADTAAGRRSFRVDRIVSATPTGQAATRPDGFDLGEAWAVISERVDELRAPLVADVLVVQQLVGIVGFVFGTRARGNTAAVDGRVAMTIRGPSLVAMCGELGGFGAGVEVLSPPELRAALARTGRELVQLYADD